MKKNVGGKITEKGIVQLRKQLTEKIDRLERLGDAWQNLQTGAGVLGKDKKQATKFAQHCVPVRDELALLYRLDGLAKRVVNVPIADMTREWIEVKNDNDNLVLDKLRSLKAKARFRESLKWQDVFGGAICVMIIDDGNTDLSIPLDEKNMKDIKKLKVYEKNETSAKKLYDVKQNLEKAGMTEIYTVSPYAGGSPFDVHESRCLLFDGEEVTGDQRAGNNGWGDSRLTAIYDRLRGVSEGYVNLERTIEEFIVGVWKKPNLKAMMGAGRKQVIQDEVNVFDMARHMINTYVLDSTESYERMSLTLAGLSDIMTKLELAFSGVVGIPTSKLFGDSPKGINAGGSEVAQLDEYNNSIHARQEDEMLEQLERLVSIIMLCKEGPTNGKIIDGWAIEFEPLDKPSLKTTLETRKLQADIDKLYWDMGVLTEEQIARNRFAGEEYSYDTTLTEAEIAALKNVPSGQEVPGTTDPMNDPLVDPSEEDIPLDMTQQ